MDTRSISAAAELRRPPSDRAFTDEETRNSVCVYE
jgi:hypothetical protein